MSTISAVKWKEQRFDGLWFFKNFLREEGVGENSMREIDTDIDAQYEGFCKKELAGKHFTPSFSVEMDGDNALIKMFTPNAGKQFGHLHLSFDFGVEHAFIIPF
jgi:hypothetical protein